MNTQILKFALCQAIKTNNFVMLSYILDEITAFTHCENTETFKLANSLTGISQEKYNQLLYRIEHLKSENIASFTAT